MSNQSSVPHKSTPSWLIKTPFARKVDFDTEIHLQDCLYNLNQLRGELQGCLRPRTTIEIIEIDVDFVKFELTEYYRVTHVRAAGSLQTDNSKHVTHIEGFVSVGTEKLVYLTILTAMFIWATVRFLSTSNQSPIQLCLWPLFVAVFVGFWVESFYRLQRMDKILRHTLTRNIGDRVRPESNNHS